MLVHPGIHHCSYGQDVKEEKAKKSGTQLDARTAENNEVSEEGFCPGHGEENGETRMGWAVVCQSLRCKSSAILPRNWH
jgi:NADH pyrophosphatase NudC (nudix superfamily)